MIYDIIESGQENDGSLWGENPRIKGLACDWVIVRLTGDSPSYPEIVHKCKPTGEWLTLQYKDECERCNTKAPEEVVGTYHLMNFAK